MPPCSAAETYTQGGEIMDHDKKPRWRRWAISVGVGLLCLAVCLCPCYLIGRDLIKDLVLWRHMTTEPEPVRCALCGEAETAGPCLLALHDGTLSARMTDDGPAYISPGLYCRACRAKVGAVIGPAEIYETGYVLVDLYDPGNIRVYPVSDGKSYDIRGYTVEISKAKDSWTVTVTEDIK